MYSTTAVTILVLSVFAPGVGAGAIDVLTHNASGSGWAHVFDGGRVENDAERVRSPDLGLSFVASDWTRPGALGAIASASGRSRVRVTDDELFVDVSLTVAYSPSPFGEGDNSGGEAQGLLSSVIEFAMPVEEMHWFAVQQVTQTGQFTGLTSVVTENVTTGRTLLEFGHDPEEIETMLRGDVGDRIRITSTMSGMGIVLPQSTSGRSFLSSMSMRFVVPEPTSLALLSLGLIPFRRIGRHLVHRRTGCGPRRDSRIVNLPGNVIQSHGDP